MKVWSLALFAACAASFPSFEHGHSHKRLHEQTLQNLPAEVVELLKEQQHEKRLFSSMEEPIDITGEHSFHPPDYGNGDQRGPCPGLNALANHGYIPRSGVVSFFEVVPAINKVYGMGVDLALVLATMGLISVGNPLSVNPGFSIGARDTGVNNILGNGLGLLGEPQGLNGSHNFVESDSSNTRDDLYVTGDASTMNMTLFREWYAMADEDGTFSLDTMAKRASIRFEQSKATNPDFYYGPVTGFLARNAGYLFAGRLFRNHTKENPDGVLTKQIVRSLFAVYGDDDDNLEYRRGWERLPENWYRRPMDWGLLNLNVDLLDWTMKYPELASIGGNTGTVNSFTGIDLSDLTGGVLNATTLLEDNNLLCFIFEILKFASPNALAGIYQTLAVPLDFLTKALAVPLLDLACPAFQDMQLGGKPAWDAIVDLFPGAAKSTSIL